MKRFSYLTSVCAAFSISLFFLSPTFANHPSLDSLQTQLLQSQKNGYSLSPIFLALAKKYEEQGNNEKAIANFNSAYSAAQKEQNTDVQFSSLERMGMLHNLRGENEKALAQFLQGLNLADSLQTDRKKADFLFLLGNYFRLQKHIDAAIEKLEEAEKIYAELGLQSEICGKVWYTKASTYKVSNKEEDPLKTIAIYKDMLSGDCVANFDSLKLGKIYSNLGSTLAFESEFAEADMYLQKAMKIKRQYGGSGTQAYTLNELSSLAFLQKKYRKALAFALEAESKVNQVDNIHLKYDILENIGLCHQHLGNYDESINYLIEHFNLRDSLNNESRVVALAELEMKYDGAKKEKALAMQELQISQQKSRNKNLLFGSALLSVIGTFLLLWYKARLRRKEQEAIDLEQLSEMKTRYFTNLSHELRTPLSLIIDPIHQLQSMNKDPLQLPLIKRVAGNADRMLQMVNQVLDINKLEAGKLKINPQQGNLHATIAANVSNFNEQANRANIQLNFSSDNNQLQAIYDDQVLEKILNNLISNAIKFTAAGGEISVILLKREQQAEIIIRDTGIGIPADQLPHIFDRFFQIDDSQTRRFEGTGIGLSLVKELVELHQGKIKVDSIEVKGTTFTLLLPLGAVTIAEQESVLKTIPTIEPFQKIGEEKIVTAKKEKDTHPLKKPLVLIIEDNWDLRSYLVQQLSPHFEFTEASNGQDGLRIAQEQIPDLIISDIMMPGMDGNEVCRQLKNDTRSSHIPLILLTAKSTQEEKIAGLKQGADDYLTKPFDSEELLLRMNNLIKQRELWQAQFNSRQILTPKAVTSNSIDEQFLTQLLEILEANLSDEHFSVEALSKTVGLSRSQLHRKIKGLTGQSTNLFLRSFRLQRARQLLEQGAGTASEIAFAVGFSNANYFFKCFKNEFGLTAGQVLKGTKKPSEAL